MRSLPLLSLQARGHDLSTPAAQRAALERSGAPAFEAVLARHGRAPLEARAIEVLQVNVGKLCNQTCAHCHVDAGPDRREVMSRETADQVLALLRRHPEIPTLDITGGAPELNPQFRHLVREASLLGRRVIDRCNLSVLLLPSQRDLVGFLGAHRVEVTASLPSFRATGTDAQRGDGVFAKSLEALRLLNERGYGRGEGLVLNLVHNPVGAFLPGDQASLLGRRVVDRCNLSVLLLPSQRDLVAFLGAHRVEVTASLPSFRASGTDAQRGDGVFARSLAALRLLNEWGYGRGEGLVLNLVHNPVGAFLPGDQASLERDYKRELRLRHGVVFDRLYTITNMPISRFLEHIERTGNLHRYMEVLVGAFNPEAADGVMCRTYLSVGWDGTLYDCDFNQMLEMPSNHGAPQTLSALLAAGGAVPRRVVTDRHCFGCTAGAGSSCAGAVAP